MSFIIFTIYFFIIGTYLDEWLFLIPRAKSFQESFFQIVLYEGSNGKISDDSLTWLENSNARTLFQHPQSLSRIDRILCRHYETFNNCRCVTMELNILLLLCNEELSNVCLLIIDMFVLWWYEIWIGLTGWKRTEQAFILP